MPHRGRAAVRTAPEGTISTRSRAAEPQCRSNLRAARPCSATGGPAPALPRRSERAARSTRDRSSTTASRPGARSALATGRAGRARQGSATAAEARRQRVTRVIARDVHGVAIVSHAVGWRVFDDKRSVRCEPQGGTPARLPYFSQRLGATQVPRVSIHPAARCRASLSTVRCRRGQRSRQTTTVEASRWRRAAPAAPDGPSARRRVSRWQRRRSGQHRATTY
eukprot:5081031-Prymnesium_polylepis.1